MNALILAAHDGHALDPATASAVAAAKRLESQDAPHILVVGTGHDAVAIAAQAAALDGVGKVLLCDAAAWQGFNAETMARQLASVSAPYRWIVAAHDMQARAVLPRAAALIGAAYASDVIAIDEDTLTRPAYAGAVRTHIRSRADKTCLTIRASAFAAVGPGTPVVIEQIVAVPEDARTRLTKRETAGGERPDLSRARIVVAGGRGIGSAQNMGQLEELADHLGAAVAASRAAVDAGFASNSIQVGQTGKTVAPDLYIAFGISGAIQHVAGIKDAKCIVAINKDPDAPIFQIADYGLVGDLFDALTQLKAGLPAATGATA